MNLKVSPWLRKYKEMKSMKALQQQKVDEMLPDLV